MNVFFFLLKCFWLPFYIRSDVSFPQNHRLFSLHIFILENYSLHNAIRFDGKLVLASLTYKDLLPSACLPADGCC